MEDKEENENTLSRTQNNTKIKMKPFTLRTTLVLHSTLTYGCWFPHSAEGNTLPLQTHPQPCGQFLKWNAKGVLGSGGGTGLQLSG